MQSERSFHILIADDDLDDQFLLQDALKAIPAPELKITTLNDGAEVIRFLSQHTGTHKADLPDALLLDINMPLKNGVEVLRHIKSQPSLKQMPVYMVTTLRNVEKLEECRKLGATNYFSKPNRRIDYYQIIEKIMADLGYQIA